MSKTIRKSGFTLIELLIVIGLLAALAAVLLPSLMGDRDAALNSVDKYNQAGTLRTLRQYEAFTGNLPNGLHTGLMQDDGTADSDGNTIMPGVSSTFTANVTKGSVTTLSQDDADALEAIGITELAYGHGEPDGHDLDEALGYAEVSALPSVIVLPTTVVDLWEDKNGKPLTFNGKGVHYLGHEGYKVIPLFIAPTAEWEAEGGKLWVKGFKTGMDIPATSPLPESGEFPYYIAYIGIKSGYEINYTKAGDDADTAPAIHLHIWAASESAAVTMVNAELAAAAATGGTFSTISAFTNNTATATFAPTSGDPTTYTFTLTYHKAEVELLGTSNPDCVVTNP
jgi:prepilin-type N-terminal cleavage/methylation domain-containing protein